MASGIDLRTTRGKARSLVALKGKLSKNNPIYQNLAFNSDDVVHYFDDFTYATISGDIALANSGGTAASNFAVALASGGTIAGTGGTDDNSSASAFWPVIWKGDNNCGMEMRLKFGQVTAIHWEVGFASAVPGSNTGAINDIDTPSAYGSNFAVVGMDTDQTLKTAALVTIGSTTGQDVAKVNCGTFAPAAGTFFTVGVQLTGNNVRCWINGVEYAAAYDAEGNTEGGTLMAPFLYVQNRGTAATVTTVDYVRIWQDR